MTASSLAIFGSSSSSSLIHTLISSFSSLPLGFPDGTIGGLLILGLPLAFLTAHLLLLLDF